MRSRVRECLTQISLYEGIEPHTDPTDLTEFARLMLNLTDALRTFASSGSHRSHFFRAHTDSTDLTDFFLLMALNLTELGERSWGISECSEYSDFQSSHRFNKNNLC